MLSSTGVGRMRGHPPVSGRVWMKGGIYISGGRREGVLVLEVDDETSGELMDNTGMLRMVTGME